MVTNAIKSIYGARSTSTLQGVLLMLMVGIMAKVVADAWFFYSSAPIPGGLKASLLSLQSDRVAREKNIDAVFDVYVIHLERHKDRWEKMQRLLKENHLHGKLFPAVDGKQLHKETLLRRGVFTRDFLHQANRGEWGCVWSHVNVWRTFLSDPAKKPFLLVLEDDVDLKKNADVALDWLMRHWVSLDWDVLLLGRVRQMRAFCTKKKHSIKDKICPYLDYKPDKAISSWYDAIQPVDYSGGAYAYIVPRTSVEKLLKAYAFPLHALADREWWNAKHGLRMRTVSPMWYAPESTSSIFEFSSTADQSVQKDAPVGNDY